MAGTYFCIRWVVSIRLGKSILIFPFFFFFFFSFFFLLSCSKKPSPDTIAQIGNQQISVTDFEIDAELYPKWSPDRHGLAALQEHLDNMIESKLVVQEAMRRRLDENPEYQKRRKWQAEDAMVQEIFRREALSKVTVSEAELRQAYVMSLDSIRVRHLFFRELEEAEAARAALLQDTAWENIARQTFRDTALAQNGGDLGWITFGEMDADFEAAAHRLKAKEISQPVKTRWGYHLIQVTDRRRALFISEEGFAASRLKLEPIIRERKNIAAANAFIAQFMRGRTITIDKKAFTFLINYSRQLARDGLPRHFPPLLDDFEINKIRRSIQEHLNDILVTFDGGQWTIGEFLERVTAMSGDARPRLTDPHFLPNDIVTMVRDKFLAEEGYRRGLDKAPEVQNEVGQWEEDILYNVFRQVFLDTMTVSPAEVEQYFADHRQAYAEPEQINIREIQVAVREQAESLRQRILAGENMATLAKKYSLRQWAAARGGEFGFFPRGRYGTLGQAALQLSVGELSSVIALDDGTFSIFQVIARRPSRRKEFAEVQTKVQNDALAAKRQGAWLVLTAQLRRKEKIYINEALLAEQIQKINTQKPIGFTVVRRRH